MYLRKLEIQGFKSFAKKTLLEFEPGIISVVGPNGSGKSNLADSLRWVFGEQSMKLLRSKKAEDIIFAGSDKKARLGAGEVSVSFDNTDRVMPIDYGEVVITRRVHRDGASEYLINGSQVRLLDIQELLNKSGFGNTSYHVIGQGMIDQLILGGPAAIKELLEEASGVKPYYHKRETAIRKLDRTEENLRQVDALVGEIEPRLRSLRRQTRKFEQRAEIEAALRQAQALNFRQIFQSANAQIQEIQSKNEIFDRQVNDLKKEIAALSEEIESEENRRQKDVSAAEGQKELETLRRQKQKLLEEQAVIRGQLRAWQTTQITASPQVNFKEIRQKIRVAYEQIQAILGEMKNNRGDQGAWLRETEKMENLLSGVLKELEDDGETPATSQDAAKMQQTMERLDTELSALTEKITGAEKKIAQLTESETERKNQLFVKERLLRNKQDTLLRTHDQKNQLTVELARYQTRLENHEQEAKTALGEDFDAAIRQVEGQPIPAGLTEKVAHLTKQLEMIGGVDDLLVQEFKETEERHVYLTSQSADLQKGLADLKAAIVELDEVIKKEFQEAFDKISDKFSEYFRVLFGGGKATMTILKERVTPLPTSPTGGEEIDNEEFPPLDGEGKGGVKSEITGIDIKATPPGKKLAGIAALSGGERALTAIALLSAMLASYPSPFVVLDEVDAALDEANSIRFGKILGTLASRTQFITITHNRETMRQSHTLYGVTMGEDGISKILSLKLEQAAAYSTKN